MEPFFFSLSKIDGKNTLMKCATTKCASIIYILFLRIFYHRSQTDKIIRIVHEKYEIRGFYRRQMTQIKNRLKKKNRTQPYY